MESEVTKILVVDDDAMMHTIMRFALMECVNFPYTIEYALDGAEAKQKITTLQPDLVITDLIMPDMSGFDLTIYLKTSSPAPFVIVMTGSSYTNLHLVEKLGPEYVLHKDQLLDKLPEAIADFNRCYRCAS